MGIKDSNFYVFVFNSCEKVVKLALVYISKCVRFYFIRSLILKLGIFGFMIIVFVNRCWKGKNYELLI